MGNSVTVSEYASEAIDILSQDLNWDLILLDHDLGNKIFVDINKENTGSTVAKFLSDKEIKGEVIIHSMNPIGAMNMQKYLPQAKWITFPSLIVKLEGIVQHGEVNKEGEVIPAN